MVVLTVVVDGGVNSGSRWGGGEVRLMHGNCIVRKWVKWKMKIKKEQWLFEVAGEGKVNLESSGWSPPPSLQCRLRTVIGLEKWDKLIDLIENENILWIYVVTLFKNRIRTYIVRHQCKPKTVFATNIHECEYVCACCIQICALVYWVLWL